MAPWLKANSKRYHCYVPTRTGGRVERATGTTHKGRAKSIARMFDVIGPRGTQEWDLIERVIHGQLSLAELYEAYRMNGLEDLRTRLVGRDQDVPIQPLVDRWRAFLKGRVSVAISEEYVRQVKTLAPASGPWMLASLTAEHLEAWLSRLEVSGSTKRKYYAAARSFCGYLVKIELLPSNPMDSLSPPKANPPNPEFLELPDVLRVVEGNPEPFRSLYALIYGTGLEVSVAINLRLRDVDEERHEIRARGTKSHSRDRVVLVAHWAWPIVAKRLTSLLPDAPLFQMTRDQATKQHLSTVKRLKLYREGITLHAARHHWAVRQLRAGTPVEVVARQLGHKDGVLALRVYGRFLPRTDERRKWEDQATRQEQDREKRGKA